MCERPHTEWSGNPERGGPAFAFAGILLGTLELNKLCREYNNSIVYALTGVPFFSQPNPEDSGRPTLEACCGEIGYVENLLYALKLEFEVVSKFSGVYSEEYYRSRICEHLYLEKPAMVQLQVSDEWVQIDAYERSGNILVIKDASGVSHQLEDWYEELDHMVLYTYPSLPYSFDPDWICRSIRRWLLDWEPVERKKTVSTEGIQRKMALRYLKILETYRRFAKHCLTKLAPYRNELYEFVDVYQCILSGIHTCLQMCKESDNNTDITTHLSTLISKDEQLSASFRRWIRVNYP